MTRGTIKSGDKILFENIEISLTVTRGSQQPSSWHGSFRLPAGKYIDLERYRLELDDGREGDMIVNRVNNSSVWFQGTGALVKPEGTSAV